MLPFSYHRAGLLNYFIQGHMFRKRIKQTFPPGTFIPTPARVVAIIQLCFSFSLLLWIISQPFMGDLFTLRSRMLVHETVRGERDLAAPGQKERNQERYAELPMAIQQKSDTAYAELKAELKQPFFTKAIRAIHLLLFHTSPWELAWLSFGIVIPILLLKRIEGAVATSWLLVAISIAYGVDNRLQTSLPPSSFDLLLPSEAYLKERYLPEPLSTNAFKQQQQLQQAWQLYLVEEWAKESPAREPSARSLQIEKGEFAFNVARIQKLEKLDQALSLGAPLRKQPLFLIGLYLFWNLLFALVATRNCRLVDG